MTNAEVRARLEKMDVNDKAIQKFDEKYDVEEISRLVEQASDPKEAMEAIHNLYPELQVEELNKRCGFIAQQLKAGNDPENNEIQELSEEELSNVAGGGLFDWYDNLSHEWQCLVVGAAVGLAVAVAATGVGLAFGAAAVAAGTATTLGVDLTLEVALTMGGLTGIFVGCTH